MKKYLLSLMFILAGFLPLSVYAQSGGPIIDSTYNWDSGLYTVSHVIGNESLTQKIIIK